MQSLDEGDAAEGSNESWGLEEGVGRSPMRCRGLGSREDGA